VRNVLRELLDAGDAALGTWVTLTDPAVVELAAIAGFDFVAIDLEHSAIGLETLQHHLRAAEARGLGTLVRVPSAEPKGLLRVLDSGPGGVLAPGIRGAGDAAAAVAACRYPPAGERGMSSLSRAAAYGGHGLGGLPELAAALDRSVVVGLMIEEAEAVDAIEDVLAVPGLDLACVGPTDLSASLGALGEPGDARVAAAVERVLAACGDAGVPFAMPAGNAAYPLTAAELRRRGASLITVMTDAALLAAGMRAAVADAGDA
jgi:4-hydroxy-2-oxoheptanedioate aldolase